MAKLNRKKAGEAVTGYLFLAPWLFIFLTFIIISLGYALYLSFTRYNLLNPPEWWGIEGYKRVLNDTLIPDQGPAEHIQICARSLCRYKPSSAWCWLLPWTKNYDCDGYSGRFFTCHQ